MKFGLSYNTGYLGTEPGKLIAAARHAEACGFESFYVPEHIVLYPDATVGPVTIPATTPVCAGTGPVRGLAAAVTPRAPARETLA